MTQYYFKLNENMENDNDKRRKNIQINSINTILYRYNFSLAMRILIRLRIIDFNSCGIKTI